MVVVVKRDWGRLLLGDKQTGVPGDEVGLEMLLRRYNNTTL